ncbi:MAG TPA: aminodeoxychorismate synthase component I [Gemmatimonadaceae bacterium]|nr:aminodeoxychorismate synthase component I [Gemmatimonadaceae bacterium]
MTPFAEELIPAPDVIETFERTAGLPCRMLLDSASDPQRLGRYSFVVANPVAVICGGDDPLGMARDWFRRYEPIPGLPPFQCGAVGYISYDFGRRLERIPSARYDDLGIPDIELGLYDWVIAWDHQAGRAWIIALSAARLREVHALLQGRGASSDTPDVAPWPRPPRAPSFPVSPDVAGALDLRSSFSREAYLKAVERVREYIFAGDIFQANLSQRLEAPLNEAPWDLYKRLRTINPAPFAAYIEADGATIISASPERFLRVAADKTVETRPIKGTSPRGISPEHDAALGQALVESEKNRAENLMIVDLLRNDLSRVCAPGTVRVPELFHLENYPTVHHLVSTVVGTLAPEADAVDLVRASFPGGSITGAPKVRAMEIIAELEPSRRGVYCGSIGYLSVTGALDTSIVIRTYLALERRVYFSVGGGIVADSDPAAEYEETLDKARALIAALRP